MSCDPPRHAFLIHFGSRQQSASIQTLKFECHGAKVEIALNSHSTPPSLVAIHFVRYGFRLPFVDPRDKSSTDHFNIRSGRRENRYFFHFAYEPQDFQEWQVSPGLSILVSEPVGSTSDAPRSVEDRPVLHGLVVDLDTLQVDLDMREFDFEFGVDNLKDVSVTLFIDRTA